MVLFRLALCFVFYFSSAHAGHVHETIAQFEAAIVSNEGETFESNSIIQEETLDRVERKISEASSESNSEAFYQVGSPAPIKDDAVGSDLGVPQVMSEASSAAVIKRIQNARRYMKETVMADEKYEKVQSRCTNEHAQCAFWASIGECDNNPGYMKIQCAPVCLSCEMLHIDTRCPLDPDAKDTMEPGDLNKMFERIVSDPFYQQFEPVIISRPEYAAGDHAENATYDALGIWMIMFNNAVSDEEADRLVELGSLKGYQRSADVGEQREDGTYGTDVNSGRTSTNAWCNHECRDDPVAQQVSQRIANITGTPANNSEPLQLLRYEEGQFYLTHNDYIEHQVNRPCGVRILTFFIYLNDVEEGGGTNFPKLGKTVTPKKGRAVLWPSVFDHDPTAKDRRSDHQALPVIKGVKYGANAWIHLRDYETAAVNGCT